MISGTRMLVGSVLLACSGASGAVRAQQVPAATKFISQRQLDEDPRLERKVTVWNPRIYTGELLELLTEEAGVELVPREGDGSADDVIALFVREQPLVEVMNAVWSLLSYREAEWTWLRLGQPGAYRYQLRRLPEAQDLGTRLRAEVRRGFQQHLELMLRAAQLPDEQRYRLADQDPVNGRFLRDDSIMEGLRVFAALTPEQQRLVFAGQKVEVPFEDLATEQARAWAQARAARRGRGGWVDQDGNLLREYIPRDVVVLWLGPANRPGVMAPQLWMGVEAGGSLPYAGGPPADEPVRRAMAEAWQLPGDRREHAAASRALPELSPELRAAEARIREARIAELVRRGVPPAEASSLRGPDPGILGRRLAQLAEMSGVPVVARLPASWTYDVGAPEQQTLAAFLERLNRNPPNLEHKWRGDFLLLSTSLWLAADESDRVPWVVARALRQTSEDGLLPLATLAACARELTGWQLLALAEEFPILRQVVTYQPLLALAADPELAERLRSPRGLPLAEAQPPLRPLPDTPLHALLDQAEASAVRVLESHEPEAQPPTRTVTLEVLDAQGGRLRTARISQQGEPSFR